MLLLGSLLLVAGSILCAERDYFCQPNPETWDNARLHCQACYKDLTTITPSNAQVLGLNLTSDYWIGLRQIINGTKVWSRWANGEPVLYQNWYPGHPVLKKKPEPQPTCPPPPATNDTKTEVMQCPAFAKLCNCLNSSGDNESMMNNNDSESGIMWCPALAMLCACMNSSENNETSIIESTTVFTTSYFITSPTPTMIASTSTISDYVELEYIEDSCVALLSFGMWQEKQCNESLPYICYDDQFYGDVEISNVTKSGGNLSWSEAGKNISRYRVEINGNEIQNGTNETSYQFEDLEPGTLYRVQVIPVKCDRNLNAQNISFYTLPEEIVNLSIVGVDTTVISLSWKPSRGSNVAYLVNVVQGNLNTTCKNCENCPITSLEPGQMYNFIVKAVVNGTIFGDPGYADACTKPSKVKDITSSNNATHNITIQWVSPDINSPKYSYEIAIDNMVYQHNGSTTTTLPLLRPGTNYTLNVSASVPGCFVKGDAESIGAYTIPMAVSNLQLTSTNDSITAKWGPPDGNFSWFVVTISSSMTNISFPNKTTEELQYTFKSLTTATLYNVGVFTYVKQDLNPSQEVLESIYTTPNSPGNAIVKIINSSYVQLSWGVPVNSEQVINIMYSVKYDSDFWDDTGNLTIIGKNSTVIGGLQSGTKYSFNITVLAGELESLPSQTTGSTTPKIRTLTLAMLCSSLTQLYCQNNSTMQDILTKLNKTFQDKFMDDVFWNLTLMKG